MKPVISARPVRVLRPLVRFGLLFILAGILSASASADPIDVTYSVSGSSGDWILNFSVTNNLNTGQVVYFFGVLLPAQDVVGSPTGAINCIDGCSATTYNPSGDGGPNLTYNNLWLAHGSQAGLDQIAAGSTLSGYDVEVTSATPPTSVDWFAYSFDSTTDGSAPYTGGGNFNAGIDIPGLASPEENPGFDGVPPPLQSHPRCSCSKQVCLDCRFCDVGGAVSGEQHHRRSHGPLTAGPSFPWGDAPECPSECVHAEVHCAPGCDARHLARPALGDRTLSDLFTTPIAPHQLGV